MKTNYVKTKYCQDCKYLTQEPYNYVNLWGCTRDPRNSSATLCSDERSSAKESDCGPSGRFYCAREDTNG